MTKEKRRGMGEEFGKVLKSLRIKRNLSTRELAEKSNVTHSYINRLENGVKSSPSLTVVLDLATALDIDPIIFLYGKEERENNQSRELSELFLNGPVTIKDKLLTIEEKLTLVKLSEVVLNVDWKVESIFLDIKEIGELVSELKRII